MCWCLWNVLVSLSFCSFLNFSPVLGIYGTTMVTLVLMLSDEQLLLVVVLCWLGWVNLCCHWLRAHEGNWQCCSAVFMCWSSLSILTCVEETILTLCARVLNTLFACDVQVAVPMKILIFVGGFPINCVAEGVVWFYGDKSVLERKWDLLCWLHCKLYVWVLVVDVMK